MGGEESRQIIPGRRGKKGMALLESPEDATRARRAERRIVTHQEGGKLVGKYSPLEGYLIGKKGTS